MTILTRHAHERVRERAIPPIVLDWLLNYGQRSPAGNGSECFYFNKESRRKLQRKLGGWAYARLEQKFGAYAIVAADGAILTIGYREKRIKRR